MLTLPSNYVPPLPLKVELELAGRKLKRAHYANKENIP